ncbi:MAG: hypothetical protein Q4F84_06390 [Fibrobacter sp.]|nr:hypothetical protein [Fibrobacter sp.]
MQNCSTKKGKIQQCIKELLDDGLQHTAHEISDYVDKSLQENGEFIFQVNCYVNSAMKDLLAAGEYVKVARGIYQKDGIPYVPTQKNKTNHRKIDFVNVMESIKGYARSIKTLFDSDSFMDEMSDSEQREYRSISEQSINIADELECGADKLLQIFNSHTGDDYNEKIRSYFKELLSDGKLHKMKEIQDYIFAKMGENNESRGERSSCHLHIAINSLITSDGMYQKISRGFYQKVDASIKNELNSRYSMNDVVKLLDKGSEFSNSDLSILFNKEYCKNGDKEFQRLACELEENIEYCIDNISYLMAFAEDYMECREDNEQNAGMTMC